MRRDDVLRDISDDETLKFMWKFHASSEAAEFNKLKNSRALNYTEVLCDTTCHALNLSA